LLALAFAAVGLLTLTGGVQTAAVPFKELLPFVDLKLPGWQLDGQPSGATVKQGDFQMSEARARFRAGDQTLEITILDFLGQPMPFMAGVQQLEMETGEEKVRTTTVQNFKALEVFRANDHQGELNISVADRFWVKIDGDAIDSPAPLAAAAGQMDLKKLAALAK
jgi:hypothetical protein